MRAIAIDTATDDSVLVKRLRAPGLPATVLPIGPGASAMPIGVQAICAQFDDRTTLAFARRVEEVIGGFVAPPRRDA